MTVFWIVVACLVAAALLFLLPPLLQAGSQGQEMARDKLNIQIHKDKLAELEADLRNGVLSQDQYDRVHQELERSLLEDVVIGPKAPALARSTSRYPVVISAIVIGALLPLLSVGLYQKLGGGPAAFNPQLADTTVNAEGHQGTIETMVEQLKERLTKDPGNVEQWTMLGRSYYFLKKYPQAGEAYGKAVELMGEIDPNLLADYADTLAMANGRSMQGRPYEVVKKALTLEPSHEKALWLAGTAAYQLKEFPAALGYWQKLQQTFPPGSENFQQMNNNIEEIKQLMAESGMKIPALATTNSVQGAKTGGASIHGTVKLVPALAGGVAPTDTVFIFARAAQGPRMPLAIIRKQVKDLPITFTLDDSLAMNPSMRLSNFKEVVVGARVSKSGNAMPQSGDLQGQTEVVSLGASKLEILINTVTP